jgi:hypothetical protein
MRRYWIGNATGIVALALVLTGAIQFLSYVGRMPAPAITSVQHLDEKLRYLRNHPNLNPELVTVGSSIAWRQFDGEPFAERLGEGRVLNGASAFLQVHQTRFLANYYADHFSHLRTLMFMFGPTDFKDCSRIRPELFDRGDASGYAFDGRPDVLYYLEYFAPLTYLRRIKAFEKMQVPLTGELWMDKYGSGPMQWTEGMKKGLRYSAIKLDKGCVQALHELISDVRKRGIRPVVVFPPLHPEYRRLFPQTIRDLKDVANDLRASTDGHVQIIDVIEEQFGPDDFFDAVHLQWPAVQRLSAELSDAVLPSRPVNPTTTSLLQ